jgi:beta-glucosidase
LAAHEKKTVHFSIGNDELTYWSSGKRSWGVEPFTFDVWVGGSSEASLDETFVVKQ